MQTRPLKDAPLKVLRAATESDARGAGAGWGGGSQIPLSGAEHAPSPTPPPLSPQTGMSGVFPSPQLRPLPLGGNPQLRTPEGKGIPPKVSPAAESGEEKVAGRSGSWLGPPPARGSKAEPGAAGVQSAPPGPRQLWGSPGSSPLRVPLCSRPAGSSQHLLHGRCSMGACGGGGRNRPKNPAARGGGELIANSRGAGGRAPSSAGDCALRSPPPPLPPSRAAEIRKGVALSES